MAYQCPHCSWTSTVSQSETDTHVTNRHPGGSNTTGPLFPDIETARTFRYTDIDHKTSDLMNGGFEYPPDSGILMKMGSKAQGNTISMIELDNAGVLSYPISINSMDNSTLLTIADRAGLDSYFAYASMSAQIIFAAGSTLKATVRAALTIEAVCAVEDNR